MGITAVGVTAVGVTAVGVTAVGVTAVGVTAMGVTAVGVTGTCNLDGTLDIFFWALILDGLVDMPSLIRLLNPDSIVYLHIYLFMARILGSKIADSGLINQVLLL